MKKSITVFVTAAMLAGLVLPAATAAPVKKSLLLNDCGPGQVEAGYTPLRSSTVYSDALGYGFTDGAKVGEGGGNEPDALRGDYCLPSGTAFHANVPDGTYQVTVLSGDRSAAAQLEVAAEGSPATALSAAAGQYAQQSFPVKVQDGQLELAFSGAHPVVNAIEISKTYLFDFGPGKVAEGYEKVLANQGYSSGRGYGFADPAKVSSADRGTADALRSDYVVMNGTSFDVDLPAGDYKVTVIAGDQEAPNLMDMKAESLTKVRGLSSAAGQYAEASFTIGLIDGQLNLELVGTDPKLNALTITKLPNRVQGDKPNVYMAGDSTVMTYNSRLYPQAGWGQKLPNYFTSDVLFTNRSIGGRSSKSFVLDGRLDTILTEIKPRDYLFIQFGHNDASNRPERYTDPNTTYKEYLSMYVDGARQRGAYPVLVTPVGRRSWDGNGQFKNDFPAYTTAMKQVAAEKNVPLLDLNTKSIEFYNRVGIEPSKALFLWLAPGAYPNFPNGVEDNTHFQEAGAEQIARLVSIGIRELGLPIKTYLKP